MLRDPARDLDSGRELRAFKSDTERVAAVAVTPDGQRAVSASCDHTLKVWDLDSGSELHTLEGLPFAVVNGIAVSSDGCWAVAGCSDTSLRVWDVNSGRQLRILRGHSGNVYGVALSRDGRRAVSAFSHNTLKVWDMEAALRALEKSIASGRLKDRYKMERRLGRIQARHPQVNDLFEDTTSTRG